MPISTRPPDMASIDDATLGAARSALLDSRTIQIDTEKPSVRLMGVRCVLEVGPGNTLARLWQAIHPEVPVRSLDDFQRPDNAATWVRRCLAD